MTQPTIEQVHTGGAHGSEASGLDDEVHALAAELSRLKRDYQDLAASLNPLLSRKTIPYLRVHGLEIGQDFFRGQQGFLQMAMPPAAPFAADALFFVSALSNDPESENHSSLTGSVDEANEVATINLTADTENSLDPTLQVSAGPSTGGAGSFVNNVTMAVRDFGTTHAQVRVEADDDGGVVAHVWIKPRIILDGATADPSSHIIGDATIWYRSDTGNLHAWLGSTETFAMLSDLGFGSGSNVFNVLTKSTAYEASPGDFVLVSGTTTITLPENATAGSVIGVKKTDSGTVSTVSRKTADTIDGATTYSMTVQFESALFLSNGSDWFVF